MEKKQESDVKSAPQEGGRRRIMQKLSQNPKTVGALIVLVAVALFVGVIYWQVLSSRTYIEKAEINAPIISLTPKNSGIIDKFYVNEGESVRKNQVLAKVGDELVKAKQDGIVIELLNTPGQVATQQTAVVKMIDPRELRVLGRAEEDKGLSDVKVGQKVVFTVDAFGSREFEGVVESIAPSARQSDIVFSISDKREVREFNVKADYDKSEYPELKNGMSAKMWIYK